MDIDATSNATVLLVSSNGDAPIAVPFSVVSKCVTITDMIEDFGGVEVVAQTPIPLHNIDTPTLRRVIEFLTLVRDNNVTSFDTKSRLVPWMRTFVKTLENNGPDVYQMILALNYLNARIPLSIMQEAVAEKLRGKTPDEIRATFGIANDFTAAEEEEVRRANQWLNDRR